MGCVQMAGVLQQAMVTTMTNTCSANHVAGALPELYEETEVPLFLLLLFMEQDGNQRAANKPEVSLREQCLHLSGISLGNLGNPQGSPPPGSLPGCSGARSLYPRTQHLLHIFSF